jgi:hypothetical protein
MKKNMGTPDRVIRLLLAAIFGLMYFGNFVTGIAGVVLLVLGVVFVLTSLVSFCPLYTPFGISTCSVRQK